MITTPNRHVRRRLAVGGAVIGLAASAFALSGHAAAAGDTATVANETLTISTGSGADRLALRLQAAAPTQLQVDFGDDGSADATFDRATFSRIAVALGSGNDTFRVDQVNGAFADETLVVDGGSGNDVMDGGDGRETFNGGSGSDAVDGNRGDDIGELGSGNDSFRWDPGDGSDVVEGRQRHRHPRLQRRRGGRDHEPVGERSAAPCSCATWPTSAWTWTTSSSST